MATIDTAKKGKQYQKTADGDLQLIHLETDDAQVLSTQQITKFDTLATSTDKFAVGTNLSTVLTENFSNIHEDLVAFQQGKVSSIQIGGVDAGKFVVSNGAATITADNARTALGLGTAATKDATYFVPATQMQYYLKKDGTDLMTGSLNMANNKVINLGTPTADTDAATKKYVDDEIGKIDQFKYILSTDAATTPDGVVWYNGTTKITGTLVHSKDTEFTIYLVPCKHSASEVQKGYDEYLTIHTGTGETSNDYKWEVLGNTADVDLSDYLPLSGGTMNGSIEMNAQSITNVSKLTTTGGMTLKTAQLSASTEADKNIILGVDIISTGNFEIGNATSATPNGDTNTLRIYNTNVPDAGEIVISQGPDSTNKINLGRVSSISGLILDNDNNYINVANTDVVNKQFVVDAINGSIPAVSDSAAKLDHDVTIGLAGGDVNATAKVSNFASNNSEISLVANIGTGKVTTAKIADSNVTDAKLSETGVTAGTYSAVTVNTKGRVTAGGQFVVYATSTTDTAVNSLVGGGTLYVLSD